MRLDYEWSKEYFPPLLLRMEKWVCSSMGEEEAMQIMHNL